jgi:hypothetical protein
MSIFNAMLHQYQSGDAFCKPDERILSLLLRISPMCNEPKAKYTDIRELLKRFDRLGIRHNVHTLYALAKAYRFVDGNSAEKREACTELLVLLHKLEFAADWRVYNAVLLACYHQLRDEQERNNFFEDVVQRCVKSGHFSVEVTETLRSLCSQDVYGRFISQARQEQALSAINLRFSS